MMRRRSGETIAERQQRLIDEFLLIDEWADRYLHLSEVARSLPPLPATFRADYYRVPECPSNTFLAGERKNGVLFLHAASDTPILAGILALVVELYCGEPPAEILRHPPVILDRIGLTKNLSPHRRVALLRIHERLVALASDVDGTRRLAS
ncbi:SufE family protein [Ancylobacter mangrovi]|uniref:SufE family protein n=1 Tax=Ancylobacter mangrovi TaxID=2972472 RepID=UPI0021635D23|nr:SufE family protein [Ancylobacter mangrovi]MCS0504759.1 SufE family protein [Ancylobacter mangrovi]